MTEPTAPPEPPNRTALYWPETADAFATLLIRDDEAAAVIVDHDPTAHWSMPNDTGPWLTWAQTLDMLAELELDLSDATRLTVGGAS